jgi:hypothetical protein
LFFDTPIYVVFLAMLTMLLGGDAMLGRAPAKRSAAARALRVGVIAVTPLAGFLVCWRV